MHRMRYPPHGSGRRTSLIRTGCVIVGLLCTLPAIGAAQDSVYVVPYKKDQTDEAYRADSIRRWRAVSQASDQSRHMGELHFLIPEYHDEQQFQIGPNNFGPMAYIYASPFLGQYKRV